MNSPRTLLQLMQRIDDALEIATTCEPSAEKDSIVDLLLQANVTAGTLYSQAGGRSCRNCTGFGITTSRDGHASYKCTQCGGTGWEIPNS